MPDLVITNFKGVYEKASDFDTPDVFADTCKDMLPTYNGKLIKRKGYTQATLNGVTFTTDTTTTVALGNILQMTELVTGRDQTSAPDESVKYLAQTDAGNGRMFLWNESDAKWHDISGTLTDMRDLDGNVQTGKFVADSGKVRLLCGNRSVNDYLWWGYIDDRFINAYSATDGTKTAVSGGFPLTAKLGQIDPPSVNTYLTVTQIDEQAFATWTSKTGIDTEYNYTWYRIAFQYDHKQWTIPSDPTEYVELTNTDDARFRLDITIPDTIDQRITGIAVFRRTTTFSGKGRGLGDYYLYATAYLHDDVGSFSSPNYKTYPYVVSVSATYDHSNAKFELASISDDSALSADMLNNCILLAEDDVSSAVFYCLISDTIATDVATQEIVIDDTTGMSGYDGNTFNLKVVRGWYKSGSDYLYTIIDDTQTTDLESNVTMSDFLGITSDSSTTVNAEYGTLVNDQMFYANCYHGDETKSNIVTYGMITNSGLIANDMHLVLNAFNPGFPVVGISSISDRLIIYGNSKISRGIIPTVNESSWDFEKLFEEYGLLAERSLVNIAGRDYFLSSDWDVKVFDGITNPRSIGDGIYDVLHDAGDANISYLQNAVGGFIPKLDMYILKVQTGSGTYEYWGFDITGNHGWIQFAWHITNTSTDQNFTGFFRSKDGSSWAFIADNVYLLNNGTDDAGIDIVPEYKTLPLRVDEKYDHHVNQMILTYRSDTPIQEDLFIEGSTTCISQTTNTMTSQTILKPVSKNMPLGTVGRNVAFRFKLTDNDATTNTYMEIDRIQLPVMLSGGGV